MRDEGARLTVEVRPRAGREGIDVLPGGVVRVQVSAPPARGAANEAVRRLLARALACPRSAVEIIRGATARTKIVRVAGRSMDDIMTRLAGRR